MIFRAALLLCLIVTPALAAEPFKIVAMFHLSGEYAAEGTAFQEGVEVAVSQLNADRGIRGRSLQVVFEDTRYNQVDSNTIAKKIISDKSVVGAMITTLHETKPSGPVLERAGVPTIVLWDSAPEIEEMGKSIFSIGPWAPDSGRKAAAFARKSLKASKAALLTTTHEWSGLVGKSFEATAKEQGMAVVWNDAVNLDETDFRTLLAKMRASEPDVLFAPLVSNLVLFAKQLSASGFKKPVIMSDNITDALLAEAPEAFEGFYQTVVADPKSPETEQLRALYTQRYHKQPRMLMFTAWGYDAVRMFAWALGHSDGSRAGVRDALYKLRDLPGASGPISMNEKGSAAKFVSLVRVNAGKMETIEGPDEPQKR